MTTLPHPGTARPDPFRQMTLLAFVLTGLFGLWALAEPRLLAGDPVWAKPLKFAVSFIVHFGTLALIVGAMSPERAGRLAVRGAGLVMAAAALFEMGYMVFQAAQGQASHFNVGDPVHAAIYGVMGVGAVLLIVAPMVVGWTARGEPAFGPGLRAGIWMGTVVSFVLTLAVAGTLSSMGGHFIGTPGPEARTIPLMGWSASVGDLRPAHFVALHTLQALALAGLWADRSGRGPRVVWAAAGMLTVLTAALYWQALMGLPVIRL